ncbi:MAG: hypothetical protein M1814_002823 [Vezdaea aestivalis]|nr:MAG: hypothetical protein M1814_002823 [Vezdaea aestivalis]
MPTGSNTTASTNTSTSSIASSTSTTAINPTSTGDFPPGWTYAGCYSEGQNGRAIAALKQADNANLTRQGCVVSCAGLGYKVAGMEFGKECYCGNYVSNGGKLATADTQCGTACSGNSSQKCGGAGRLSVFSLGNLTVYPAPTVQKDDLPGSWVYQGCLQATSGGKRSFKWQLILPNNNNATTCLSQCSKFGYMAAGMEYGRECYCGDDDEITATGAQFVDESNCKIACTGNPGTICGGLSVQSFYRWKGTPLYVWNYPQGNNAGQYQFLIGGVVVPLLTSQAVNGKVVYLEKSGTGAPNTTGAYELDLAQLNNFTAAWRPMHVKTDVFCGAGVTLPDRAGRILNIGGWSLSSTFGVRLYWPDGSPGQKSKNDWQENVSKLSLQKGRWYPGALVLNNGSVLVVGGQVGSNSAPQPSLEILPRVGPPKFLEWLNRTDPLNLYPFLSIMPSGKILAVYYNEALLMDPVTFETVKQLPQIPGSVNAPQAGRTYPLEGTAVLLPIRAPYTAPVTVLVCGGSTPGPAYAADNCVTSQPDAADSSWTIERMPSQRVISCMAALPDGTYLIANGARHGVAGFGLANDPNFNSVLYDPSKPVNQRMSIMGNTTVARLYHSEAILLQDGRVLISGSDPQSKNFPEEFRNEVWVPPYLLSGLPRPSYTIANKDWSYGQSVQFTLTAGSSANITVSMMASEVSTHGNSFGQRTIFPDVSCSGNTCTITTPPRAEICPAGWYQFFVLDGPTPSVSQFIRIGGDPGSIGNWPQFPEFSLPGVGPINGTA